MSDQTGKLACTLWSFALGGLAGALATVMLVLFGNVGWNGAVFLGAILAVALAAFLALILCRPLPTMAQVQARSVARVVPAAPAYGATGHVAPTPDPVPPRMPDPVPATSPTLAPAPAPLASPVITPATMTGSEHATKPVFMTAARDGQPDDLKVIRGVGPKLEVMLHEMGVYHFDQIAAWTPAEVAWVDDNLEGFKGRVSRDGWVSQARTLAAG